MFGPITRQNHLFNCLVQCNRTKLSPPVVQEKRGHRESRLLDNLNKSAMETNEQMPNTTLENIKQQLSDVIARC